MDPRDRADAALARAQARGGHVVTPDNAISPMDASSTIQIPRVVVESAEPDYDDPETTIVLDHNVVRGYRRSGPPEIEPGSPRPQPAPVTQTPTQPLQQPVQPPAQQAPPQQAPAQRAPAQQAPPQQAPAQQAPGPVPTVVQQPAQRQSLADRLNAGPPNPNPPAQRPE